MPKKPIWLDDTEAEVLLGYVGEILDDNKIPDFDRGILDNVYAQLEED